MNKKQRKWNYNTFIQKSMIQSYNTNDYFEIFIEERVKFN